MNGFWRRSNHEHNIEGAGKVSGMHAMKRAFVALLAVAVLLPAAVVIAPEQAQADEPQSAKSVLNTLPVKGRAPKTGYSRSEFGKAWADVDKNGCDTRNDVLKRDLTKKKFKAGTNDCKVMSGNLADPYTGKKIHFKQGKKTSSKVQIDHVVALSNAWQTGAQALSAEQRQQLANDPYNLLAVDGPSNQKKKDGDAATWLPKNKKYRCDYVSRQIGVKHKYGLWVTAAEKKAMNKTLKACPAHKVAQDNGPFAEGDGAGKIDSDAASAGQNNDANSAGGAPVEPNVNTEPSNAGEAPQHTRPSSPAPAPQPAPAPVPQAPAPQAPAPAPAPAPQPAPDTNVYYQNCTAVRAAGKAPLYAGQPGYRSALDRDHDGIACE